MSVKKTDLLAIELEVIADGLQSRYNQGVLKEAAERLRDLEAIAKFYHGRIGKGRNEICRDTLQKR